VATSVGSVEKSHSLAANIALSVPSRGNSDLQTPGKDPSPWADESSRAMEVMGGEPVRMHREVTDAISLAFTMDEWRKIFNISSEFIPSDANWLAYHPSQPIVIHFIRRVTEGAQ